MGILVGRVHITCPKTGKDVILDKACIDPSKPDGRCEYYEHWGTQGPKIVVSCRLAPSTEVVGH